jgi:hypothetical protein
MVIPNDAGLAFTPSTTTGLKSSSTRGEPLETAVPSRTEVGGIGNLGARMKHLPVVDLSEPCRNTTNIT